MFARLVVLGRELVAFEFGSSAAGDPAESDEEETPDGIAGGSTHNFVIDDRPLDPNARYAPWYDDKARKFGFE